MNTKNKNDSKIVLTFYKTMYELMQTVKFDDVFAGALVATYSQMRKHITLDEFTMESLREIHKGYHSSNGDDINFDWLTGLSESAFVDLVHQMRNPEVQSLCEDLRRISCTDEIYDLYLQVRKTRLLSDDENGPAVVTLVVDSLSVLTDLLLNAGDSKCQNVHYSEPKVTDSEQDPAVTG